MKELSEKKLDEAIEEIKADVTQDESVDENVSKHMGEMGFLWERVQQKLHADGTCFQCKQAIDFEKKEPLFVLEASGADKGIIAFASVCEKCKNIIEEKQNALEKEKETKKE